MAEVVIWLSYTTRLVMSRNRSVFGQFTGARATLYECPSNTRSIAKVISAEEVPGSGVTVTVEIYKSESTSRFVICNSRALPVEFYEHDIVLEAGDRVEVTANGTTPVLDAMVTVDETFIPVG